MKLKGKNNGFTGFRFRLGEMIGQGSFGRVLMGFNKSTGWIMAVKQVQIFNYESPVKA